MQGRSDDQRDMPDAESVTRHLRKAGSVFGFVAVHRPGLCCNLSPAGRGRPSVAADVMAAVIALQALHGLCESGPSMRSPSMEDGQSIGAIRRGAPRDPGAPR